MVNVIQNKTAKGLIMLSVLLLFIQGCNRIAYKDIGPKDFKELINNEEVSMIDVHIP